MVLLRWAEEKGIGGGRKAKALWAETSLTAKVHGGSRKKLVVVDVVEEQEWSERRFPELNPSSWTKIVVPR